MIRPHCIAPHGIFVVASLLSSSFIFAAAPELGRLTIPSAPPTERASVGLEKLGGRNGLLYVPPTYRANEPLPLLILLHGSRGSAAAWFSGGHPQASGSYSTYADAARFIILAPEAPSETWGVGPKSWGYDYVSINHAIEAAFARCAIDRNRLAIGGFSDGASYALSLGLANGDLFGNVIAFSPGYIVRAKGRGRRLLFISHGTGDNGLPIASTSRIFAAGLRKNGYNVDFQEFGGGHTVPRTIADQAVAWLTKSWQAR
jgi:phospholipase/carboxylesterase